MSLDIPALDADLFRDEGKRNTLYADTLGNFTIGRGHKCSPEEIQQFANGITDDHIQAIYLTDRNYTLYQLDNQADWWRSLADDAQRALANQAYQLGVAGILRFENMITALKIQDYATASYQAMDSEWARQVPERAARIAALYQGCAQDIA